MKITKMKHLKNLLRAQITKADQLADTVERVYNHARGKRNTLALVRAAEMTGATIATHDVKFAEQLSNLEKVKAQCFRSQDLVQGIQGPLVVDLPVLFEIIKTLRQLEMQAIELLNYMDQRNVD